MIVGESVDVNITTYKNTLNSFNTKNDMLTNLLYLDYLAYNEENKICRIQNKEISQEWLNVINTTSDYSVTNSIIKDSKELPAEKIRSNEKVVAKALDKSHIHVTSNHSYNNEDVLQFAIYF